MITVTALNTHGEQTSISYFGAITLERIGGMLFVKFHRKGENNTVIDGSDFYYVDEVISIRGV